MKFRDYFSLKQILFAVAIVGLMMLFAVNNSNNIVKVKLQDESVSITSSKYNISIDYADIVSVSLEDLAEPGVEKENCHDDKMIRTGIWENGIWGTYYICADLDVDNCVVVYLQDGRTFVFSRKSNAETEKIYQALLTHLKTA